MIFRNNQQSEKYHKPEQKFYTNVYNNCKNFSVVKMDMIHKINLQEENDVLQGRKRFCTTSALANLFKRGVSIMAKNTVPEAKEALNRFKMEAASEVGVFLH